LAAATVEPPAFDLGQEVERFQPLDLRPQHSGKCIQNRMILIRPRPRRGNCQPSNCSLSHPASLTDLGSQAGLRRPLAAVRLRGSVEKEKLEAGERLASSRRSVGAGVVHKRV
jgi:hypothetical protein